MKPMKLMNACIIDDEMLARKRISHLLAQITTINVIKECSNGRNAITTINNEKPDIIFLDINMKDLNGFEVLQGINFSPKPIVVFVTAYDQYALKAFDYDAFDFLLKPFEDERFFKTIDKALKNNRMELDQKFQHSLNELIEIQKKTFSAKESKGLLPIRQGNKTTLLEYDKIRYVIASGYYADIFTKSKKHVLRESLGNLMEIFDDENFFRVSRSAIVNLKYIQEILHSNYSEIDIKMKDNKIIRVSKPNKKSFLNKIGY
ncbi:MAG: response regulator transcription factor [Candidatus Bathyarchaeota archaeon]|nr:response regulator transcription factor [Candidatus Bathyarchaeota archaeon]